MVSRQYLASFDNFVPRLILRTENRWQCVQGPLSKMFVFTWNWYKFLFCYFVMSRNYLVYVLYLFRYSCHLDSENFKFQAWYITFGKTVRHYLCALSANDIANPQRGICYYALFAFVNILRTSWCVSLEFCIWVLYAFTCSKTCAINHSKITK